ncbi:hypothetical protein B0H11DRAFT_2256660 [Mycena galericulata]|nr:hypothetical protein B0H11DRAFT_2256660 [Mycena galericulata]
MAPLSSSLFALTCPHPIHPFILEFTTVYCIDSFSHDDLYSPMAPSGETSSLALSLGAVKSVTYDEDRHWVVLELCLPCHSDTRMDTLFWNQTACLSTILAAGSAVPPYTILQDVVAWSIGPSPEYGNRIIIHVPYHLDFARATPRGVTFDDSPSHCRTSSNSSTTSSSTLSSSDNVSLDEQRPVPGDLLAIQCALHRRDVHQSSLLSMDVFQRIYVLRAVKGFMVV